MNNKVISVYGYGRFGKFWADLLTADFKVKVYSRRGLKPEEVSPGIEITDEKGIFDCDALFYCVAISSLEDVLVQSTSNFKEGTVVFDTCSVKMKPAEWMQKHVPANNSIIATHPMFGPDSYYNAKEPLPMVMANIRGDESDFKGWTDYFTHKFMRVELMSPEQHDEMVAYSQGITHYIGRVLADLDLKNTKINTLGYQKLMEIIQQTCNDNWQLFVDLQRYNPYTKKMRQDLHESIEKIYTFLKVNDLK
jgi:prephenate dehydrogenase